MRPPPTGSRSDGGDNVSAMKFFPEDNVWPVGVRVNHGTLGGYCISTNYGVVPVKAGDRVAVTVNGGSPRRRGSQKRRYRRKRHIRPTSAEVLQRLESIRLDQGGAP